MVYNAKTQRGLLVFLLAIMVTSIKTTNFSEALFYFQVLFTVFILVAIFIKFKFKIDDGYLTYQILFLTMPIYKKVIYPNQIIQMKFKRVGWATKGVIIRVKKGFNIRVIHFVPDNLFAELIDFANEYEIAIAKTKDYLVLDK